MRSAVSVVGIVLIVLGALALAYEAITYTRTEEILDVGPLEVQTEQRESVPIPPVVGFLSIAGGIGLMLLDGRRRS